MPNVPYNPVPTPGPSHQALPEASLAVPASAFGADVAASMQSLGNTIEGVGGEIFKNALVLQKDANEAEAREADTNYMIKAGELHAQYNALQGQDAVNAFPKYAQDLKQAREEAKRGLSNPASQRLFDSQSLSTMGRSIFNGAGHAATENKKWNIGAATAQINLDAKTVEDNPQDPNLFGDKLRRVEENARTLSKLQGLGEGSPQEKLAILTATSKLRAQQLIGLSRVAPFEATTQLEKYKTQLTQEDYLRVDNTVRAQGRAVGAVNIANEVYQGGLPTDDKPGKTLAQMEEEAKAKATAMNPDDPILAQHAVTALRGQYNQDKYARRQEEIANYQTVMAGIERGVKDERELRLDPTVASAIDALPKDKRLSIPGQINRYNAARDKVTNQDTYQRLNGLSNNDVEAFLNTDLTNEKLSQADMRALQARQVKLKERVAQDPRVNRAVSWMRGAMGAQMQALDVYRRTDSNKDSYDHFTGAVQSALDVWQEDKKKPPTYKEFIEQIAPEILQSRNEPGMIFGSIWPNKKPFFEQTVPSSFSSQVKADVIAKGGAEPTDEQIYRAYVRKQLIELYGKKKSDGK